MELKRGIEPLTYALRVESRSRIESMELSVSVSVSHVASASSESDYDDDNTDRKSQNHKQGSSANGRTFIECIVTKHRCHKAEE